ncbi:glycosyltransferase family 4 protein [Sulfurimonas sp.]|uniref:glycosyltransferase family 4 protein n=1 Tax=Sulfurimonas sp. TaxID=2022749 RepID=UPI00356A6691
MKTFVTLFEKTDNIHLIKDVGQIPYLMYKYFDYKSKIVTYKNKQSYDYLEDEVKGLKLEFIPKVKIGRYSLSILWYLFFNAKKIDVLHMFHHREKTYLNFLMYKWRNPDGIAFLKSDTGLNAIKEHCGFIPGKRPKYAARNWLFEKALEKLDVISVESIEGCRIVSNKYKEHRSKFLHMPNGIDIDRMYSLIPLKSYQEKENIILTVGRIGAPEKNNEFLLNAVENIDLKDYKVIFVGSIETKFISKIDAFYKKNPNLKDRVIFTDAIYDRKELYKLYAKSKIFCLTSIEESFGFVLIEAMAYENYILTTPISSANEITNNEIAGTIISSQKELENKLSNLILNEQELFEKSNHAIKRVKEHYSWKSILEILNKRFRDIENSKLNLI